MKPTSIEVMTDEASFIHGRVVRSEDLPKLISRWSQLRGQGLEPDKCTLSGIQEHLDADALRDFIFLASGGFSRMIDLKNKNMPGYSDRIDIAEEDVTCYEALMPDASDAFNILLPSGDHEETWQWTKVEGPGFSEDWIDGPAVIRQIEDDDYFRNIVRNGGFVGVKRMVHMSNEVLERLECEIVLWCQFFCKRAYIYSIDPESASGQAIATGPFSGRHYTTPTKTASASSTRDESGSAAREVSDEPEVALLRLTLLGNDSSTGGGTTPAIELLIGFIEDDQILDCADVMGPWHHHEEFGPIRFGWRDGDSHGSHLHETDLWAWP